MFRLSFHVFFLYIEDIFYEYSFFIKSKNKLSNKYVKMILYTTIYATERFIFSK